MDYEYPCCVEGDEKRNSENEKKKSGYNFKRYLTGLVSCARERLRDLKKDVTGKRVYPDPDHEIERFAALQAVEVQRRLFEVSCKQHAKVNLEVNGRLAPSTMQLRLCGRSFRIGCIFALYVQFMAARGKFDIGSPKKRVRGARA